MKNRAKCKLCQSTIESFHSSDYVLCKCGEIAVDGGEALLCFAKDFHNFLRVDDEGNEICVKIKDDDGSVKGDLEGRSGPHLVEKASQDLFVSRRDSLIKELDEMIAAIENLPKRALYEPVPQCDLASVLMLLSAILKS